MPELPEVEVVRAGLEPVVTGATIRAVSVYDERSLRRHDGPAEDFVDRLVGRTVLAAVRRGKFLWLPLSAADAASAPSSSPAPASAAPASASAPPAPASAPPASVSAPKTQEILRGGGGSRHPLARSADSPAFSASGDSRAVVPDDGGGAAPGGAATGQDAVPLRAEHPAEALVVHLGMSGQVLLRDEGRADDALLRVRLVLELPGTAHTDPEPRRIRLDFVDQRIFGSMAIDELVPTLDGHAAGLGSDAALIPTQVAHIARDPLDRAFSDSGFVAALRRRKTGVKRALLDQTLVSGVGNIYADEALWAARIHYDQPTSGLSAARARTLLAELRLVLGRALAEGGTSFDAQYVNVNGASGYFSHSLNVYGQHGRPCPRCGRPLVREQFMNRGSHFCSFCQRIRADPAHPVGRSLRHTPS